MIANILVFLVWFSTWLLLSWPPDQKNMLTGAVVALFVSLMTMDILVESRKPIRNPFRFLWFLEYIAVFILQCLKANIDVAYRVLHPDLPIRPGTIRLKTELKSDTALTFLANSVTLTPGTTTVDIDKDRGYIYVHCLYVKDGYDKEPVKIAIVSKFERILKRIFK